MSTDDELSGLIGDALRVEPGPPSEARRLALRRAVEARAATATESAARMPATAGPSAEVRPRGAAPEGPHVGQGSKGWHRFGRRELVVGAAAAVAGVAIGVVVAPDDEPSPTPDAVPTEALVLDVRQASAIADGRLINHTWGTELLLDVSGLTPGRVHDVVYTVTNDATVDGGADGAVGADAAPEVQAGSFLAVAGVVMHCRFNAATLRADLSGIQVRDRTNGETVIDARLV